jgi:hypothetical protein
MFPRGVVHYDSLPAIRTFAYTSGDRNPITYFRDLSAIVRHLKTAGAKVIVAEDPVYYKTRDSVILKTLRSLRESLREEGVLFHEGRKPSWFWSVWGSEASPNDTATFQPSSASVSVLLRQIGDLRSVPLSWFPALYRGASPHLDLALIAAARFQGIPDTTAVVLRSGTVKFGPLEISVDDEGRAVPLGEAASPQVFLPVGADRELMSDTLWYNVLRYRRYTIERMREFPVRDAESARGCIVLVSWWYLADEGTPSMEYAGVLSSLLNGRIARQYGHAPLWISAAGILVSLVLCAALRPRSAVPLVVLSAAGTFACGVWLLSAHSIMLSSAYPSLAMLLSAIVFPIVRLAHEHS